jgi:hypothetical protein
MTALMPISARRRRSKTEKLPLRYEGNHLEQDYTAPTFVENPIDKYGDQQTVRRSEYRRCG